MPAAGPYARGNGRLGPEAGTLQVSMVDQEVLLFDLSVLENIRLAKPAASDEEVHVAARRAQARGLPPSASLPPKHVVTKI